MGKIKNFFKENKKDITKYSIQAVLSVIVCGLFLFGWLHYVRATSEPIIVGSIIGSSYGTMQSRYEITESKDSIAHFNLNITWKDGISEDYGQFGIFLGTPLKLDMGDGWRNVTTAVYYSPMLTSQTQDNIKLIVKPKKAKLRGDPTFIRGIDYRNDTRSERLHIVIDGIYFDEETGQLTYNFAISIDTQSKDNYVTNIQIINPTAIVAEHP